MRAKNATVVIVILYGLLLAKNGLLVSLFGLVAPNPIVLKGRYRKFPFGFYIAKMVVNAASAQYYNTILVRQITFAAIQFRYCKIKYFWSCRPQPEFSLCQSNQIRLIAKSFPNLYDVGWKINIC
jgi:hypothetical protein